MAREADDGLEPFDRALAAESTRFPQSIGPCSSRRMRP